MQRKEVIDLPLEQFAVLEKAFERRRRHRKPGAYRIALVLERQHRPGLEGARDPDALGRKQALVQPVIPLLALKEEQVQDFTMRIR